MQNINVCIYRYVLVIMYVTFVNVFILTVLSDYGGMLSDIFSIQCTVSDTISYIEMYVYTYVGVNVGHICKYINNG